MKNLKKFRCIYSDEERSFKMGEAYEAEKNKEWWCGES